MRAIENQIPEPYSAEGLYRIFADGYLPVPYLWECKDEFARAIQWQARLVRGSVKVVDETGKPMPAAERMRRIAGAGPSVASVERMDTNDRRS